MLHLAHRKEGKRPKIAIRGGELTYSDGLLNLRLDAETGRLKELRCTAGNWIKRDFLVGRLEQGAFDKTAGTLRTQGQAYRNWYDEGHKIGSSWDFTLDANREAADRCRFAGTHDVLPFGSAAAIEPDVGALYGRWVELTGVDPTDAGVAKVDRCRQFNIPQTFSSKDDEIAATIDNSLFEVPAMADLMFSRGSWPWTISREACFWKLREQLYGKQLGPGNGTRGERIPANGGRADRAACALALAAEHEATGVGRCPASERDRQLGHVDAVAGSVRERREPGDGRRQWHGDRLPRQPPSS